MRKYKYILYILSKWSFWSFSVSSAIYIILELTEIKKTLECVSH